MGLIFQQEIPEALGRNRPKRCLGSATGKDQRGCEKNGFWDGMFRKSFGAVREIGGDKDGFFGICVLKCIK